MFTFSAFSPAILVLDDSFHSWLKLAVGAGGFIPVTRPEFRCSPFFYVRRRRRNGQSRKEGRKGGQTLLFLFLSPARSEEEEEKLPLRALPLDVISGKKNSRCGKYRRPKSKTRRGATRPNANDLRSPLRRPLFSTLTECFYECDFPHRESKLMNVSSTGSSSFKIWRFKWGRLFFYFAILIVRKGERRRSRE